MEHVRSHGGDHRITGLILHGAMRYDWMVWLMTAGRERALRERMLRLLRLTEGETVLDIGCGTGTLTIAAKRKVGPGGAVHGIDASPEMIARADRKARKARLDVNFKMAPAQALPFPGAQFDAAVSTIMFHHLPRKARAECACEMRRVLKPGGRALIVDFAGSGRAKRNLFTHAGRHGHVDLDEIAGHLREAGFVIAEQGPVGTRNLQFALGTAPLQE